jgi:hypothetical protein
MGLWYKVVQYVGNRVKFGLKVKKASSVVNLSRTGVPALQRKLHDYVRSPPTHRKTQLITNLR